MNRRIIHKETFHVIGIGIHTSNQKAMEELPALWEKFTTENIMEKIPDKVNEDVLAVYTGYEGDYTKPYTYILGCEVRSLDVVPKDMISTTISFAKYEEFSPEGKIPDIVLETWQCIWTPQINAKRAYITDFEVYRNISDKSKNPEVQIYIGIK